MLVGGPRGSDDIAAEVGSDPDATYRLLRLLASEGVLTESVRRRSVLTPLGATLRSDVPGSMRGWVSFSGSPAYLAAFARTLDAVRTGRPGWVQAYGMPFFTYLGQHHDRSATFDAAMTGLSAWEAEAVVAGYDFSSADTVVDVGGGWGVLLARLMQAYPRLRGVLFDQAATPRDRHIGDPRPGHRTPL